MNPIDLVNYNLVLTTYGLLAADFKARGILQKVAWLRVVLDEGKQSPN